MTEKEIIKALREMFGMPDDEPDAGILFLVKQLFEKAAVGDFLTDYKKNAATSSTACICQTRDTFGNTVHGSMCPSNMYGGAIFK